MIITFKVLLNIIQDEHTSCRSSFVFGIKLKLAVIFPSFSFCPAALCRSKERSFGLNKEVTHCFRMSCSSIQQNSENKTPKTRHKKILMYILVNFHLCQIHTNCPHRIITTNTIEIIDFYNQRHADVFDRNTELLIPLRVEIFGDSSTFINLLAICFEFYVRITST